MLGAGGCSSLSETPADLTLSWVDPSEMAPGQNYRKAPLLVPILNNLNSGYSERTADFAKAEQIRAEDLKATASDYIIGAGDVLNITLTEVTPGVETLKQTRVTDSGNITLPLLDPIKAAGLTEAQLEKAIHDKYADQGLIKNANVSVTVVEARQRTFQIMGAQARTGQYAIVQTNFRITDALILAGVSPSPDFTDLYVVRPAPAETATTQPSDDLLNPAGKAVPPKPGATQPSILEPKTGTTPVTPATPAHTGAPTPGSGLVEDASGAPGAPKRVFISGATTMPAVGKPTATTNPDGTFSVGTTASAPFEFEAPLPEDKSRIIRVPLKLLLAGDLRYNIVVRPNDTLIIPTPVSGEYYVGGHVARVGVYSLSSRMITLKQAIISAGMLDQVAIPQRTEIIRRIGDNQEVFYHVNLALVFSGRQPDLYLKPYDQIMVGTNAAAPFIAAFRNAYRITYGFGFVYDRNFQ